MELGQRLSLFKSTDLYFVTCQTLSESRSNIEVVEAALRGGVRIVQYREKDKDIDVGGRLKEAKALRVLTKKFHSLLIINDQVDLALEVGADGVHLGQQDTPLEKVKKKNANLIVGVSCHNQKQASSAQSQGADYVNLGPIFDTQTKKTSIPIGTDLIKWAKKHLFIPFTVMGGINETNIKEVIRAGAKHVAVITALSKKMDIEREAKILINLIRENQFHKL